jgi:L-seryl-tRNA(Ser) seleniumtransferase
VHRLRRHPLARALRVDKLTLAALEATLRAPDTPTRTALRAPAADLRRRAGALAERLRAEGVAATAVDSRAVVGGGGAPGVELLSSAIAVDSRLAGPLRQGDPPVVGRLDQGRLLLDLRSVPAEAEPALLSAVVRACR